MQKTKTGAKRREGYVCPECGAVRVVAVPGSGYAVCPSGHGRLYPRFTTAELVREVYPAAVARGRDGRRNLYKVESRRGRFVLASTCRVRVGEAAGDGCVVARLVWPSGRSGLRVFTKAKQQRARK